jgi:endonuclease/exonuclease/phosphatase family metal-dependent hydrolase
MKILKLSVYIITLILALLTIVISTGSAFCKFADFPKNELVQACGYLAFFWVIILSVVVLFLFLTLKKFRIALSYFVIMIFFTILLNDFSLRFIRHKVPENNDALNSLKIGAYNIKYYAYGIEKISKFLRESDFDVILLSESVLTPEKLEYLKKNWPEYNVLTDNGHDLSILSKYPVLDYKIVELPTYLASLSGSNDIDKLKSKGIHRSFVHAVINVNGTDVNVLSLRLIAGRPKDKSLKESIRWGKYLLIAQHDELTIFLSYLKALKGPFIFGGDLNVPPNSAIVHEIKRYADDTYLDGHPFGSFTFKVNHATMRIDYLFHSKDIISEKSEVMKPKSLISDHYPIRAEFFIPGKVSQTIN